MKLRVWLSTILLLFVSGLFSRQLFNDEFLFRVVRFGYVQPESIWDGIQIERTIHDVDPQDFYADFESLANKHGIVFYKLVYSSNSVGGETTTVFCSYNEDVYGSMLLTEGAPFELNQNDNQIYSSFSDDKNLRIATFLDGNEIVVTRLINEIDIGGYFAYRPMKGRDAVDIQAFLDDLQKIYGPLSYIFTNTIPEGGNSPYQPNYFDGKVIKILFSCLLAFFIILNIFSLSRKISIFKLEGKSDTSIYWDIVGRHFITSFFVLSGCLVLISLVHFRNFTTFYYFVKYFLSQSIQLGFLFLAFSLFSIAVIRYINPVNAEKGESKVGIIFDFAYLFKFCICLFMIPSIISNLGTFKELLTLIINYPSALNRTENMYYFGTQITSNWFDDIGTDKVNALYEQLVVDVNMIDYSGSYIDLQNADFSQPLEVFSVGYEYLELIDLVSDEFDKYDFIIIYNDDNASALNGIIEKIVNRFQMQASEIHLVKHNETLPCYSIWGLFHPNKIRDYLTVYIPVENRFSGQVNGNIFTYNGSKQQAQEYIDSTFESYGYSPTFRIESVQNTLTSYLYNNARYVSSAFFSSLLLVLIYILNDVLMLICDFQMNRKRFYLSSIENVPIFSISEYSIRFLAPLLFALLAILILGRIHLSFSLIYLVVILILIEFIVYWIIYRRYLNVY